MVGCSLGAMEWIRTDAHNTCAGIEVPCSGTDCTKVAVGPCNTSSAPSFYIQSEFIALAFIGNSQTYTSDPAQVVLISPYAHANNGYRDYSGNMSVEGGGTYAYVMSGAFMGLDPAVSGGFVGTASYLMKSGSVSTNVNSFYYASVPGAARVDRTSTDGSVYGHPDGPVDVCIAPKTNDACGPDITYSAGDYKFTIYGRTMGSAYTAPSPSTYLGFRFKLTAVGLSSLTATFNANNVDLAGVAGVDVTSMRIGSDQGTVEWQFPTQYNVGDAAAENGTMVPLATKTVKIRGVPIDATSMYVDYLFDGTDFQVANKYFVYDPTQTATNNAAPAVGSSSGTSGGGTGGSGGSGGSSSVSSASSWSIFIPMGLVISAAFSLLVAV